MSRDSSRTHLHLHHASHADLFEEFTRLPLAPDTIFLAPHHMPVNPEDEDDVVPDQHAAFGIARAAAGAREPPWRELGLMALMTGGPTTGVGGSGVGVAEGGAGNGLGLRSAAGGGVVVGPVGGGIGVPVGVRTGMRVGGLGGGDGAALRG
jgi:Apc13p protein